jgi:RHS repeat-associated protein
VYEQRTLFQSQELQDELNIGWVQFKWRNHEPSIGRFFNVDPIAEDYYYNSPYAFAENRVIDGNELEGLEWKSIHDDKNKTTVNVVTIKVRNISSRSNVEAMGVAMDIASQSEKSYSGRDADGNSVITKVSLDFESEIKEGDFFMELRDNIQLQDGSTVTTVFGIPVLGRVDKIGDTQKNRIQVNIGSL